MQADRPSIEKLVYGLATLCDSVMEHALRDADICFRIDVLDEPIDRYSVQAAYFLTHTSSKPHMEKSGIAVAPRTSLGSLILLETPPENTKQSQIRCTGDFAAYAAHASEVEKIWKVLFQQIDQYEKFTLQVVLDRGIQLNRPVNISIAGMDAFNRFEGFITREKGSVYHSHALSYHQLHTPTGTYSHLPELKSPFRRGEPCKEGPLAEVFFLDDFRKRAPQKK